MTLVYVTIIAIALVIALLIVFYTLKNGIPPMPTTRKLCQHTEQVIAQLSLNKANVIEAGSGWGTLAFYLSNRHSTFSLTGLENSPIPYWTSQAIRLLWNRKRCKFVRQSIYTHDYRHADLIVCYLYAGAMRKLDPIWRTQLPIGAYIVSIFFALPGWQAIYVHTCDDLYRTKIYVYQKQVSETIQPLSLFDAER